jgi:hypothetical protein
MINRLMMDVLTTLEQLQEIFWQYSSKKSSKSEVILPEWLPSDMESAFRPKSSSSSTVGRELGMMT